MFTVGMFLQATNFALLQITNSMYLAYGVCLCVGLVSPMINLNGYVYMCEFLPPKWQDHAATIYCVLYASVAIVLTFYYEFINQ
jgi:MoaA/NifB/PqqE/SkfB family radical SAM enzyme